MKTRYEAEYQWHLMGICIYCGARCYYNDDLGKYIWRPINPECNCTLRKESEEDDQD